jgi:hypothetical protein
LVLAVPFVVAVEGLCDSRASGARRVVAVATGAGLLVAWMLAVRAGPATLSYLERVPGLTFGLALATLAASWWASLPDTAPSRGGITRDSSLRVATDV